MKIVGIVQARMGSTRFPGKVLEPITGVPLIELLLTRLSAAEGLDEIVLATSICGRDTELADHVTGLGYRVVRGSEDDVLSRYYQAARIANADAVVRITGDCPLVSPLLVDELIRLYLDEEVDFASNTRPPTYPDGLDVSMCSMDALENAWLNAATRYDREHLMPYVDRATGGRQAHLIHEVDLSSMRWTVDEPEDLVVVSGIFQYFSPRVDFTWLEALEYVQNEAGFEATHPGRRNEGSVIGSGLKLWSRAKRLIPGGGMLLSKRPEMFLPGGWPTYFKYAKGCRVWDLDEREFIDVSIMGIGTNILGYGHPDVDAAVRKTVAAGNMSTLNCAEEVLLAERMVAIHPWADMVRFARTGGEANAIAVRIGRAATGRDKVVLCGYHGWHDWYLASNLACQRELDGHLLPGLEPNGVPRALRGTTLTFEYNRFDQVQELVDRHSDIAVIIMEVQRNDPPRDGFLESVRKLASEVGIVLVFDECTSGFRETFGGLHKKFGVEPDMAMFGKALGNGYAITALIGRREVMQAAQRTFISSTFWTERIGPAAALATLDVMERERSWDRISATGRTIGDRWESLGSNHNLPIRTFGLPALVKYTLDHDEWRPIKTFIAQEMLARGFLAANSVYVCTEHSEEVLSSYFDALDEVFGLVREAVDAGDVRSRLHGPVCHTKFRRVD